MVDIKKDWENWVKSIRCEKDLGWIKSMYEFQEDFQKFISRVREKNISPDTEEMESELDEIVKECFMKQSYFTVYWGEEYTIKNFRDLINWLWFKQDNSIINITIANLPQRYFQDLYKDIATLTLQLIMNTSQIDDLCRIYQNFKLNYISITEKIHEGESQQKARLLVNYNRFFFTLYPDSLTPAVKIAREFILAIISRFEQLFGEPGLFDKIQEDWCKIHQIIRNKIEENIDYRIVEKNKMLSNFPDKNLLYKILGATFIYETYFNKEEENIIKQIYTKIDEGFQYDEDSETYHHGQIILTGVPGTGKTYWAKRLIYIWETNNFKEFDEDEFKKFQLSNIESHFSPEIRNKIFSNNKIDYNIYKEELVKYLKTLKLNSKEKEGIGSVWEIVQFHPSYTYEEFIEGYKPVEKNGKILFELKDGIFKKICKLAKLLPDYEFYLIIDEINRANLSSVFGELIYALEYRGESVILQYSREPLIIPENLYIIGTMNTTDKTIGRLDFAMMRRFAFVRLEPLPDLIEDEELRDSLKNLNNYLKEKLGEDFQIGHSYFINRKAEDKEAIWNYNLEHILREYLPENKEFIEEAKKKFGV